MSYATIKTIWRKLFGFDVDAKRAPLPPVEEHSKQLQHWLSRKPRTIRYMSHEEIEALRLDIIDTLIKSGSSWERAEELTATLGKNLGDVCPQPSTSRVDAILAEIDQAHANGLVWDVETHSWQPPKPSTRKPRLFMKSNGPVTAKDMVLDIFPGAEIIAPPTSPEDWQAILEEASRWSCDPDGVWCRQIATETERTCAHCKPGKIVPIIEPDGTQNFSCHRCGRRVKKKNNQVKAARTRSEASAPRP